MPAVGWLPAQGACGNENSWKRLAISPAGRTIKVPARLLDRHAEQLAQEVLSADVVPAALLHSQKTAQWRQAIDWGRQQATQLQASAATPTSVSNSGVGLCIWVPLAGRLRTLGIGFSVK